MTSNKEEQSALKSAIAGCLVKQGWRIVQQPSGAFAAKIFQTAVGPKEAHAYLVEGAHYCTLSACYWSEGRNALDPVWVKVEAANEEEAICSRVEVFSASVSARVAGTYAARLFKLGVTPNRQPQGLREAKFQLDAYGEEVFEGLTDGQRWNGWACPLFTKEVGLRIAEVNNAIDGCGRLYYDSEHDAFIAELAEYDEPYIFEVVQVVGVKYFPIGSHYWTWTTMD